LATYLYLIDPPRSEPSSPIDPNKIVIAGDSAGGGLTFALLLAIRDGQLPLPAGGMTLSAWLDLTHSLPSIMTNIMTDYLPPVGFRHAPSPALDYEQLPILKSLLPEDQKLDTFGDDLYRLQFYAPNKALKNPMVSPLFDKKHLRGLPRLLMVGAVNFTFCGPILTILCSNVARLKDSMMSLFMEHF
jgi:acetyl esterase/lipase